MKEMQNGQCRGLEERVLKAEDIDIDLESKMRKESDEDSLLEQMMVNKALEVEKQMAEDRADEWKRKFEKLAETVRKLVEIGAIRVGELELDEDLKLGLELASVEKKKTESLCREGLANNHQVSGCTPCVTTPVKDYMSGRNRDGMFSRRRVNKMLVFEGVARKSTEVVDLSDSEEEERLDDGKDTLEERSVGEEDCEDEDVEACEVDTNTGRKRKRVITSDSENDDVDDEDNIPIATLKNLKPQNHEAVDAPSAGEGLRRRQRRASSRLRKQRDLEEISTPSERQPTERLVGIPMTGGNAEDDEDDENDETEEEFESESLNGFIVDDESASEDGSDDAVPEEGSDEEAGYADVISRLRRDKRPGEQKWNLEGDMLSAFGKDPELCMRAVCVLYRFQTEGEKATRSSHVANGRGFSMFDADRGTRIGQFLTDGDPEGDLKKTVEELRSFEFNAVEICGDLARHYSKQLFEIYNNREDPFFVAPPSP